MTDEEKEVSWSREELLEITKQTLGDLIASDPLLRDLPKDVTPEEITAQLALLHGQSITIFVHKENGEVLPIVVSLKATVLDLKRAIRRHVSLSLKRSGTSTKLSWRYVWKNNQLVSGPIKLDDDNATLSGLGLSNRSSVHFKKKLRLKNSIKLKRGAVSSL